MVIESLSMRRMMIEKEAQERSKIMIKTHTTTSINTVLDPNTREL